MDQWIARIGLLTGSYQRYAKAVKRSRNSGHSFVGKEQTVVGLLRLRLSESAFSHSQLQMPPS